VIFISELFPGSASDKELTRQSKVLENVSRGDLILADKGFTIHDMLPSGVYLNIPPFLFGRQFPEEQVKVSTKISQARIHVERVIQRIKTFDILSNIPYQLRGIHLQYFSCAIV
jgi:hypothetical protein